MPPRYCARCGKKLAHKATGRPRLTCSVACRVAKHLQDKKRRVLASVP